MSLRMPSRGGVRGGKDQFDWEDVKADKYRENYLGHSLKAPIGHVHKVREQNWYLKDGSGSKEERLSEELRMVKEMEARGMAIALGQEEADRGEEERKGESISLSDKMVKEILGVQGERTKKRKKNKKEKKAKKHKYENELKVEKKALTKKKQRH